MKGCCGAAALVLLCGVGGAVSMTVDPNLPGQTLSAGASGVAWLTGVLSHAGDATPHSATLPAGPAPIVVRIGPRPPARTPLPPAPATPSTAAPSPHPSMGSASLVLATPAPTPTPVATVWTIGQAWGATNLAWATTTLQADRADDLAAETRFPASAAYYAGWAQDWSDALTLVHGLEFPQTRPPQQVYLDPAEQAFALASSLHRADEATTPANAWWDDLWIANYARLLGLWAAL